MILRRPTPSSFAASVSDSPNPVRHSAKSAPVIGSCSSAIRRSVEAETSNRPHLVSIGQARPRPSSTNHDLGEGLSIVHQRREVRTASNEPGHVEFMVLSIARKTDKQNMSPNRAYLCDSRYFVAHADYLWNSSHIVNSSARFSSTQRRACLNTLFGASPASNRRSRCESSR